MFTLKARFLVGSNGVFLQRSLIFELFIALRAGRVVHLHMTEFVVVQGSLSSKFQPTGITFVHTFCQVNVPDVVPEISFKLETPWAVLTVVARRVFRVGTDFVRMKIGSSAALMATNFADPEPMCLFNVCRQIPSIVKLFRTTRFLAHESKLFALQMHQLMPVIA